MRGEYSRRSILRGVIGGSAVTVALPILPCLLNDSGTAFAATGAPLPVRFGTWFWGCGMNPERWNPTTEGPDYDLPPELQPIQDFKEQVSVLSGYRAVLDGRPNHPHHSGVLSTLTGTAPQKADLVEAPTLDVLIADTAGSGTRFRALDISAIGDPRVSYSRRSASVINPPEVSPLALYTRVFGPEFQDPNAAEFTPDPRVMVRKSVLSAVKEDRRKLLRQVGAHDRTRLDDYFTAVRQMEQQLALQLQKPPPAQACEIPAKPGEMEAGAEIEQMHATHRIMTQLLATALACNQTKVFNVMISEGASRLRKAGSSTTHHQLTHEEPVDRDAGYQREATYFVNNSMAAWADFLGIMSGIQEGDGTLLDNCAILAHSDVSLAKVHDVNGLPAMIAGRAGGRLRAGVHVKGNGDPITRIGLTLQQVMGLSVDRWGTGSMQTSRPVQEILA